LIDQWDGRSYQRVLAVQGNALQGTAPESSEKTAPRLYVVATGGTGRVKGSTNPNLAGIGAKARV